VKESQDGEITEWSRSRGKKVGKTTSSTRLLGIHDLVHRMLQKGELIDTTI